MMHLGTHNISITLTDEGGASSYYWFTLKVLDSPKFISPLIKTITVRINSVEKYTLPIDLEENYLVQHSLMPTYCTFNYPTYFLTPKTA